MQLKPFFPPATNEQIERFESRHGIALPNHYRTFLLSTNGGQPLGSTSFALDIGEAVMLGALYGISNDDDSGVGLANVFADLRDDLPSDYLPIGEDPGGNLLLLALTGSDKDGIYFWDRLGFLRKRTGLSLYRVADSIDAFLQSLRPMTDAN